MVYGKVFIVPITRKGKQTCYIRTEKPDGIDRVEQKEYKPHTGLHMFNYPSEILTEVEAVKILCDDMEKAWMEQILKISKEIADIRSAYKKYTKGLK